MKAKLVNENIDFKRGLTDDEIKKSLLGPRIGTLYFDGGRFPYLWMLVKRIRATDSRATFYNLGHFRGGGRRKTDFMFTSKGGTYEREFRYLKEVIEKPKLWKYVEDRIENSAWGPESRIEWIEEETGIKPIIPIFESNFHRATSDREVKSKLFGIRPGQLVTPVEPTSQITQHIAAVQEIYEKGHTNLAGFGYIFRTKNKTFFERMSGQSNTTAKPENYRVLNNEEGELVRQFMKNPANSKFISAKERQISRDADEKIKIFI